MSVTSYQFWATLIALIFCVAVIAMEIVRAYLEWKQEKICGYSEESRTVEVIEIGLIISSVILLMSIGGA